MASNITSSDDAVDWKTNATRLWGIPLNPVGEMSVYEVVTRAPGDLVTIQNRLKSLYPQLFVLICIGVILIMAFITSIRTVVRNPRFLAGWCCFVSTLLGAGYAMLIWIFLFDHANFRILCWYMAFMLSVSGVSNSLIVLQKAYIVLSKRRWVLIAGITLIISQLGFFIVAIEFTYATISDEIGLQVDYPMSVILYWFCSNVPAHALFSGIFSYVSYKQYKTFGSDAWKRLMRNGIQIMALVAACNILCATTMLLHIGGKQSQYFVFIDWLITTIVLVHYSNSQKNNRSSNNSQSDGKKNKPKGSLIQV